MRNASRVTKSREIAEQDHGLWWELQRELNDTMNHFRHFQDLFEPENLWMDHLEHNRISPAIDIIETKECFRIEVEMPGIEEKNIKVTVDDNTLKICGEKMQSESHDRNFIDREIRYGCYERSISLPKSADWNHVSATFDNGLLCVTIPKTCHKKCTPKQVKLVHSKK